MKTFALDSDDNITVLASVEETNPQPGVERFHSAEQFAVLAKTWPGGRLVQIWNQLPGVGPVKKFTDRHTGVTRIWKALQGPAPAVASRPKRDKDAAPRQPRRNVGRTNTKAAQVMALLQQPSGASLKSVMKATGWLAHSVRGFISGHLRKKLGLRVKSFDAASKSRRRFSAVSATGCGQELLRAAFRFARGSQQTLSLASESA